jgi:uncharacterized membrane protein YbaN (DUF454 family)
MKERTKHLARKAAGIGLVTLGLIGLVLPIMPGWLFLIPGAALLGVDLASVRRRLRREARPAEADPADRPPD